MGVVVLVSVIIALLVSSNFKSMQAIKLAELQNYSKKINQENVILNEDIMIANALKSFCVDAGDGCYSISKDPTNTTMLDDLSTYSPDFIYFDNVATPYKSVLIDRKSNSIKIIHNFKDVTSTEKYTKHYKNKFSNITCSSGTYPNCVNNEVIKILPLSKQLALTNIQQEKNEADFLITIKTGQCLAELTQRKNYLNAAESFYSTQYTDQEVKDFIASSLVDSTSSTYDISQNAICN